MDENTYLIPANAKKSTLILGFFTPLDLIIFGIGSAFTIIMLLTVQTSDLVTMILIILPILTASTLVMPIPHYHNVMQLLINIFTYFSNQRTYKWKGWCIHEEEQ